MDIILSRKGQLERDRHTVDNEFFAS